MPEVYSVVAIFEGQSQASEALTELERAGCDMAKISIVGDAKTGRVFIVCDGPCVHVTEGLSSGQAPGICTCPKKNGHAQPVKGRRGVVSIK